MNDRPDEPTCNQHPDAPHGFCRQASHGAGRYVCECEGWSQPSEEYKELTQDIERCRPVGKALDSAIAGAQTYEAIVRDAERYRWITRVNRKRELRIPAVENKNSIDAAIDKAMGKP